MTEVEKKYIDDEIVLIDKEAKTIVLEKTGAVPYSEVVAPFLNTYKPKDKVKMTIYGNPEKIMFIKKAGTFTTKKAAKTDTDKKALGYVYLNGKWYATLEVLLNKIHKLYPGRHRILTKPIKLDMENKSAVFSATVQIIDDEGKIMSEYNGIGDADKTNLNSQMQTAFIRMAETRSIVRALRWATNIAETAYDELPSNEKK